MNDLAVSIAGLPTADAHGTWYRHVPARIIDTALDGRIAPSRWGSTNGFPILYLGAPPESVLIEAYRHIVDPVEDLRLAAQLAPRRLVTCHVHVSHLLDLRTPAARIGTGLTRQILESGTDDKAAYGACRHVAAVAHQLGLHGLIAPAATRRGETLVLFTSNLPVDEVPSRSAGDVIWDPWPNDPRVSGRAHLTVVRADDEPG